MGGRLPFLYGLWLQRCFFSHPSLTFLTVPAPVLTIVGSALAIILAFKNQQCYARFNEALSTSGQLTTKQFDPGQQADL